MKPTDQMIAAGVAVVQAAIKRREGGVTSTLPEIVRSTYEEMERERLRGSDALLSEAGKYERAWQMPGYRDQSDGAPVLERAFEAMGCQPGETLIDWGCGSGRDAAWFANRGLQVTGFDIAANCLDPSIRNICLTVGTLWNPPDDLMAEYAFSADVLEHVPPEFIHDALQAIALRTRKAAYIQVDTVEDTSGKQMNPPEILHLTVQPAEWWGEQLRKYWGSVLERDGAWSRVGFLCGFPMR